MKSIKEIEKMTLEELEVVSLDENLKVPTDFAEKLRAGLNARKEQIRATKIAATAASIVLLAGIGFSIAGFSDDPKDTFTDPYLAYAQIEETLAMISEGMKKGIDMAQESETIFVKSTEIFK